MKTTKQMARLIASMESDPESMRRHWTEVLVAAEAQLAAGVFMRTARIDVVTARQKLDDLAMGKRVTL